MSANSKLDPQRAEKRDHVLRASQTRGHTCHWPGCGRQVPPAMWGCKPHWMRLPYAIREAIWAAYSAGQEERLDPSDEYMRAAERAQEWIRQNGKG